MRLEQAFEVDAPAERVWAALLDIERVAPCLPGAAVQGHNDDGSYNGTFSVKIGPTTASYAGKLLFENVDEDAQVATMQASGTDRRGQGGARATIVSAVESDGEKTRVRVDTDYQITGRLARFGRGGMVDDIAERLLREFAQNLQALLQQEGSSGGATDPSEADPVAPVADPTGRVAQNLPPAQPPEPLDAGSLVAAASWQRLRSSPLVPALMAALLILTVLRRRRGRS